MLAPVHLLSDGRAAIFDRETGAVMVCSVPTAIENVANGQGRYVHGETGEMVKGKVSKPEPAPKPEPVIALTEPDVLPLPTEEEPPAVAPEVIEEAVAHAEANPPAADAVEAETVVDALDHDGDGKKGGTAADERREVIAALKAKGVKFFAGASTDKLKEILAAS